MQDSCYAQAAQDATGPYYQAMEQVLQANYGATSLWEMAVNGLGFTGAQYTTEFAYTMDTACPMLFGTEDKAICFLMFGLDMSEIDPSCGAGGSDGYLRYLNDLEDAAT